MTTEAGVLNAVFKPTRVLLIEDNPGDARLLKEMLSEARGGPFCLQWAHSLSAGLEYLADCDVDVVLLDLSLPDSQGLNSLARLQTRSPQLPIIVLTGLDDEDLAATAVRKGAQDYLIKGQVDPHLLTRAARYAIERRNAEQERRRLQERLIHAQKMEAVGTLAGGIAHEFNNINGEIIAFVDLTLEMECLSNEARRNLETVRSSAAAGAHLTKSLLTFSREDIGEKNLVRLKDVVDGVLAVVEKQFAREQTCVEVDHADDVPQVMANAQMLESVVMNLVINARHAMLSSPVRNLAIQTGIEKARPFLRVRDTGCGIPEENISKIFEPFYTTKGALAGGEIYDGKAHGTGLGLSVCHTIVKGHGGEIAINSRVSEGTTVTVYLPSA
jgi:two-component system cell cycle sensor histidine kinase/response regulator CckA